LTKGLNISLNNNLPEKTEEIKTKLSDALRREATSHRRSGNPSEAIESADEAIKNNPDNPGAHIEGITNSEKLGNHNDAVYYAEKLDEINITTEIINVFPLDDPTINDYKNSPVELSNEGTAIAKTANPENIGIDAAIKALETADEYFNEALIISNKVKEWTGVETNKDQFIINKGSTGINLIALATQAEDAELGEKAIDETEKLIADNPAVFSDETIANYKINAGTFEAGVKKNYAKGAELGMEVLNITDSAIANHLVGACLAAQGGKENVITGLTYIQKAVGLDPTNENYLNDLNTLKDAIAMKDYDIENFVVGAIKEPDTLFPEPAPTDLDTDGDSLNDNYEIKWGLNPENPDENGNFLLDGYEDPDGDNFLTNSEMLIDSNPFDAKDPNLDDMLEVEPGVM